jgi:hypothetical protein
LLSGGSAAIEEIGMKRAFRNLSAAGLAFGMALAAVPVMAQQPQQQSPVQLKPVSSAALAAAKEILVMKKASEIYAGAVPNMVQQVKGNLTQKFLNYQKDLNEVAVIVAQNLAGREQEIGEGMAKAYAGEFTEQELKDLVAFYKSPLGQKLLVSEPKAIQLGLGYMNQWANGFAEVVNGQFRAEMKKRGKDI